LDGSAKEWIEAIEESGICIARDTTTGAQVAREALVIDTPITVSQGDSFVAAFPSPFTRLTYGIDFPQVIINMHVSHPKSYKWGFDFCL
jgi:UDP-3-O-[3-hydroxymyristoyl] N-acetylglucosamine deacetylase